MLTSRLIAKKVLKQYDNYTESKYTFRHIVELNYKNFSFSFLMSYNFHTIH